MDDKEKVFSKTPSVLRKLASLTAIRDIEVFELSILKTLLELLHLKKIALFKFNDETDCRQLTYETSENDTGQENGLPVMAKEPPEIIKQAQEWVSTSDQPYVRQLEDKFQTVYPIRGIDQVVGFILLELDKPLSQTEMLIVSSLLSISHNFHSLLLENQRDKLTGLLNRKTFEESICKIQMLLDNAEDEEADIEVNHRQQKNQHSYWLAMLDIDRFKKINDSFGHVFGDEVLLLFAQLMKTTFRSNDLIFRFGGEEFIVILKASCKQDVYNVLERFRQTVEAFQFPQVGQVTVSIGVTQMDEAQIIPAALIARADQALYFAKNHGRNCLYFYQDLVDQGLIQESEIESGAIELF